MLPQFGKNAPAVIVPSSVFLGIIPNLMRILPVSITLVFSFDKLIVIFATCRFRYRKVIVYFIGSSVLRFFYRHQFCNYIHDCHDLTLDPYFSSHFTKASV